MNTIEAMQMTAYDLKELRDERDAALRRAEAAEADWQTAETWLREARDQLNKEVAAHKENNRKLEDVARAAAAYLAHSDNGLYCDSAGLRPGASPQAEGLRAALEGSA